MNIIKCKNGHFYDTDNYPACPHCEKKVSKYVKATIGVVPQVPNQDNLISKPSSNSNQEHSHTNDAGTNDKLIPPGYTQNVIDQQPANSFPRDDAVTVGFYQRTLGISTDPVVGWLVCIEGNGLGKDYRLKSGRNFIGRSPEQDINIEEDDSVSRGRHAVIIFEPISREFLVQPGDTKELCYLNGKVVLQPVAIKVNDVLTIGKTKLMFAPLCGPGFSWNKE